ncbi:MAG: hypothetical protein UY04_C0005G0029 [Parcubacteria group bacterium GW2011_GWA2_47_7]|nr:MAG: hypothetical protein UY04_C0005G0029 [Parcubacteria group bacterium GW2011_GWA2_47_7]
MPNTDRIRSAPRVAIKKNPAMTPSEATINMAAVNTETPETTCMITPFLKDPGYVILHKMIHVKTSANSPNPNIPNESDAHIFEE